jgi:BMFP domain-containing protein YqiC
MQKYLENNVIEGNSYEIVINRYLEDLVLIYPVSHECTVNIKNELQNACNQLDIVGR